MVCASDCRVGHPGSVLEKTLGDAAAAFVIGTTDVAVTMEGAYAVHDEIIDVWRNNHDDYVRNWEPRFGLEQGYMPSMTRAVAGLMKRYGYAPGDFAKVVVYDPDGRRGPMLARALGFDATTQLAAPLLDVVGDSGAAAVPLGLVGVLEEAGAGDLILCAAYGNGAEAFAFKVHEPIEGLRAQGLGLKGHLASKRIMADYLKYLRWRGILPIEKAAGPHAAYSAPAAKREYDRSVGLVGSRCTACGYVQYPPQRVCAECRKKDEMEPYRFAGRQGTVFTYNLDYITPRVEVPVVTTETDFEGGGRIQGYMTEVDEASVHVGMPVVMTFRRYTPWSEIPMREGVYTYFWESKPLR